MGDRSNIFIQTEEVDGVWQGVGVYSHWHGTGLHDAALAALPKALARKGDPAYFARILIHNVLNVVADPDSATGTGIWTTQPCDNEHPVLVINAISGKSWWTDESAFRVYPFED